MLRLDKGALVNAVVVDEGGDGAGLRCPTDVELPRRVELICLGLAFHGFARVMWRRAGQAGVRLERTPA